MPATSFSNVLLPDPFRPAIPKNSPFLTSNDTPSRAAHLAPAGPVEAAGEATSDAVAGRNRDAKRLGQVADLNRVRMHGHEREA